MTARAGRRVARVVVKVGSSSLTTAAGGIDPAPGPRAGRRARPPSGPAGAEVVLVSSGAIAAGLAPLALPRRPRDLATQQAAAVGRPGAAGAPLHRGVRPARRHRRPGAAHRRRRDPAQPLPQRLPHVRQAARAGRAADRQRERHRGHLRDPVRRQRPARGAGRAPRARRPAAAAQRRRRALRRRPRPGRRDAARPRCPPTPTWPAYSIGRRRRRRGRHRRHAAPRSRPPGSPPAPASRWCSPPPRSAAAALAGEPVGTVFHPTGKRRPTRLLWLAHATEAEGPAASSTPARSGPLTERRASLLPAGITGVTGTLRRRRPGRPGRPRRRVPVARGLVNYDADELPGLLGPLHPRPGPRAGRVVRARGRAPRRPGAAAAPDRAGGRGRFSAIPGRLGKAWQTGCASRSTGSCPARRPVGDDGDLGTCEKWTSLSELCRLWHVTVTVAGETSSR